MKIRIAFQKMVETAITSYFKFRSNSQPRSGCFGSADAFDDSLGVPFKVQRPLVEGAMETLASNLPYGLLHRSTSEHHDLPCRDSHHTTHYDDGWYALIQICVYRGFSIFNRGVEYAGFQMFMFRRLVHRAGCLRS